MKSLKAIRIGGYSVGDGKSVFIIAEAGVNHNGSLTLAKKLIDAAKEAGADAVKFQTFEAQEVVTERASMAEYQRRNTGKKQSQLDMIRALELSADEFKILSDYCKKKGIIFISAPHSGFGSVDILQKLQVPAFKFGSGDLNNFPVLEYAARFKKPMIISTGMADEKDVQQAVACIRKAGNEKIIVFQCTTDYPSKSEDVNLRAMVTLREKLKVLVGYSDHTIGMNASIAAVALGACVLEKHLTLDTEMEGPDHKASANPKEFKEYVKIIRDTETILGSSKKTIAASARPYMPLVLKSVVARGKIRKGEKFTKENVAIKRPADGLEPEYYFSILGKKAKHDLEHDQLILKKDYA